jgi:hypothetical protein
VELSAWCWPVWAQHRGSLRSYGVVLLILVLIGATVGSGDWPVSLLLLLCLPVTVVAWGLYLGLSVVMFDVSRDDLLVRLWFAAFWLGVAYMQVALLAVLLRRRRQIRDPSLFAPRRDL